MKYNCHTHIFNIKCIPENFLGKGIIGALSRNNISFYLVFYLKRLSRLLVFSWFNKIEIAKTISAKLGNYWDKLLQFLRCSKYTRWLAGILSWMADVDINFLEKYANFVEAGRERSQELVFEMLRNNPAYDSGSRFIVLTLDMDFMGCGKAICDYNTQLSQIISIKKRHPYQLLPFVSVDPRRGSEDFIAAFVKRHIEQLGFCGIKLYPALGFFPFDVRLNKMYAYAEQHHIPILSHCTQGGVYYKGRLSEEQLKPSNLNPSPLKNYDFTKDKNLKTSEFKNHFSSPDNYKELLEVFPKLKICIAHLGGSSQVLKSVKGNADKSNWYLTIKGLISGYKNSKGEACENMYADISYTLFENRILKRLADDIKNPAYADRILFGTDFYLTQQEKREELLVKDFLSVLNDSAAEKRISFYNPVAWLQSDYFNP